MAESLTFRIFNALPIFAQNLAFTALGHRQKKGRYGPTFQTRLQELIATEMADPETIQSYQDEQVQRIVTHAATTVPYYRDLFATEGLDPRDIRTTGDLDRIPILTKEIMREEGDRLVSDLYDPTRLQRGVTSGTSGKALVTYHCPESYAFQWACVWRHRARFGFSLGDPFLMFGGKQLVSDRQKRPPWWRRNGAWNQTYLSIYSLTDDRMDAIHRWLDTAEFAFWSGFPSGLALLAAWMKDNGKRLSRPPGRIFTGSEVLTAHVKELMEDVFDSPVSDIYGMREGCVNFATCEHDLYHESWEFSCVELLDIPESPDGPKRIVTTGFANDAWPLIRYEVMDLAIPADSGCDCGRHGRVYEGVDGRAEDYVRTPDGRRVAHMIQVFKACPGATEGQIVQKTPDAITVRIVQSDRYTRSDTESLLEAIRDKVGPDLTINIDFVDALPRTRNGKVRPVISELSRHGDAHERALAAAVSQDMTD